MEILIPGLILVALMVWASTKIKKRASAAFDRETVATDDYSIVKPEGFLHVLGSSAHEFEAYSKEFGDEDAISRLYRATIEIDAIDGPITAVRDLIEERAQRFEITGENAEGVLIETDENTAANESSMKVFYKLLATPRRVYRLRFAALEKHSDEFKRKIDETLDSFHVITN